MRPQTGRGALRRCIAALMLSGVALLAPFAQAIVRVAVISDLNGSYGSTRYEPAVARSVKRLVELQPDLVISTGDMVAGQRLHPRLPRPAVEAMWQGFHAAVTDPIRSAGIPLAVTPGNHDASAYPAFVAERDIYRLQWQPASSGLRFLDAERYPFDYAFALDDVMFASLDVTRVGALEPAQRAWLDAVLASYGADFRYRVVFSHLPVYPFTRGRETEVSADHALERLLQRHRVDVYLSGHHHAFYPGYHAGIRYVSQACLGAGPRALIGTDRRSDRGVTWIEFSDEGISIDALTGPRLERRIARETLPETIRSRFGTLVRDDLSVGEAVPAPLSPRDHAARITQ